MVIKVDTEKAQFSLSVKKEKFFLVYYLYFYLSLPLNSIHYLKGDGEMRGKNT
ncbi:hypothetical protein CW1_0337 [Bacteroides xylanisolvens SD CC 2a]|uniref:Uncharacterized protein n=1 Tax=Bacteroides xylanisolvens SD CC 1b TaxID=702447 RepID=D4VGP0_9BACE|nr:hypothetical protein CW1_0337 [Bacteroides xylanisolvens SD CC 2a]EFG14939.1 hypothetical protein CW3_1193 [Bacteroides xylanisolvens SD CC 1b]CDL97257.1 hypothetical protein BN891_1310 [Bacteroides xylanisolvens SD CC 2a]CDM05774.1 hypothetical protein BN890_33670 [Bacteroides xylanisolvens SD CC 1b]